METAITPEVLSALQTAYDCTVSNSRLSTLATAIAAYRNGNLTLREAVAALDGADYYMNGTQTDRIIAKINVNKTFKKLSDIYGSR
jgi:hypothetical protein